MEFNKYQVHAMATRLPNADLRYGVLNLAGEAGEVASKYAKSIRDGYDNQVDPVEVAKELGDVLWCVALICEEIGVDMNTVATMNIDKLASRAARGVLAGSGDNR